MQFPGPAAVVGCLLLAACATDPGARLREANRATPQIVVERPAYPGYGEAVGRQSLNWSHASLARDFGKIMFETEWGGKQTKLLKWKDRVEVAVASKELDGYRPEIARYVSLLDANTPDLSISLVPGSKGDITFRTAPAAEMSVDIPATQCFITPVDMDWPAFLSASERGEIDWEKIDRLEKVTIFIPAFSAPVNIRECILEELIQALGPANDLYGLEDSLFNDDEAHIWPTAFDLKILDILYSDGLVAGMNRKTAVSAAKQALARSAEGADKREWPNAAKLYHAEYHRYLITEDKKVSRDALKRAENFAKLLPENDHRRGEVRRSQAFIANGASDYDSAVAFAEEAIQIFETGLSEDSLRLARMRSDYGYFLSKNDRYEEALVSLEKALPVLAANAAEDEFVQTLRLRAYVHIFLENQPEAQSAARETIAWARYAYGADSRKVRKWSDEFRSRGLKL